MCRLAVYFWDLLITPHAYRSHAIPILQMFSNFILGIASIFSKYIGVIWITDISGVFRLINCREKNKGKPPVAQLEVLIKLE
ncbi:hypothetical protein [Bacillus cereus]